MDEVFDLFSVLYFFLIYHFPDRYIGLAHTPLDDIPSSTQIVDIRVQEYRLSENFLENQE